MHCTLLAGPQARAKCKSACWRALRTATRRERRAKARAPLSRRRRSHDPPCWSREEHTPLQRPGHRAHPPTAMAAAALPAGFASSNAPSAAASPSSPAFPSHAQSSVLNGHGINLALRPGTSFGTSHLASPPQTSVPSFAPTSTGSTDGVDYATLPSWDDTAVALWLAAALPNLATQPYADVFAANDIRGAVLLEVDQSALKEMGVRSVGDRVKICVAIRALRGKYLAATQLNSGSAGGAAGGLSRRPSARARLAPTASSGSTTRPGSTLVATSPAMATGPPSLHPNARAGSLSYSARNISVGNRIPPPLHLAQSNAIPSPSSSYLQQQRSPPSHATSPRSAVFPPPASATSTLSSGRREVPPPPSHPPPSGGVPPPPPSGSHGAPSPTNWLGEISGLPPQALPPPQPSTGLTSSASTSSLATRATASYGSAASSSPSGHRKASSSSYVGSVGTRPAREPSPYAGHPYGGGAGLLPSAMAAERAPAPAPAPALPAGPTRAATTPASSSASPTAPLSNLEVMRKAVKFTSADGVTTRVLAVADAKDGREVLARVMKKFGGREGEDLDGWGVWVTENNGAGASLSLVALRLSRLSWQPRLTPQASSPPCSTPPDRARAVHDLPERVCARAHPRTHRPAAPHTPSRVCDALALDLPARRLARVLLAAVVAYARRLVVVPLDGRDARQARAQAPVGFWRVARRRRRVVPPGRDCPVRRGGRSRRQQPNQPQLPHERDGVGADPASRGRTRRWRRRGPVREWQHAAPRGARHPGESRARGQDQDEPGEHCQRHERA